MKTDSIAMREVVSGLLLSFGIFIPLPVTQQSDEILEKRSEKVKTSHLHRICVGANIQVSHDYPGKPHYEVILAADPHDAKRLMAASVIGMSSNRSIVRTYRSLDAGATWQSAYAPDTSKGKDVTLFDPTLTYGPEGEAYFGVLLARDIPGPHVSEYYMEVVRSLDGGKTWNRPVRIEGFNDRPYLSADVSSGKRGGRLYLNSGLHGGGHGVRISVDRANTFRLSPKIRLQMALPPPNQAFITGQSIVLTEGTLLFPYCYFLNQKASEPKEMGLSVRRSADGGMTLVPSPSQVAISRYTSQDGVPMLAANPRSIHFKDRIYLIWSDALPTGHRVMLAFSRDKGTTWSRAVRLDEPVNSFSHEEKANREQPIENRHDALLPSIAVNKEGVVCVWWYQMRDLGEGNKGRDVYFRASCDGGKTWLSSVKATNVTSILKPSDELGVGDTAGMAADATGAFHLLWIDSRMGTRQVFTARVSVETEKVAPK